MSALDICSLPVLYGSSWPCWEAFLVLRRFPQGMADACFVYECFPQLTWNTFVMVARLPTLLDLIMRATAGGLLEVHRDDLEAEQAI